MEISILRIVAMDVTILFELKH